RVVAAGGAAAAPGQQVGAGQFGKGGSRLAQRDPGQARRGKGGDVGPGVHAAQGEHARRRRAQVPVGPGEHRAHVGGRVLGGQRVQARHGQFGGQVGQGEAGVGSCVRGRYGQGQRQAGTEAGPVG